MIRRQGGISLIIVYLKDKQARVRIYVPASKTLRRISLKTTIKVRASKEVQLQAFKSSKCGILNKKGVLNLIEKGAIEPFELVSKNLTEKSASIFERYKYIAKTDDIF